jgi:Delta7-sterol 5-desaturase
LNNLVTLFVLIFIVNIAKYALIMGIPYVIFYIIKPEWAQKFKIQKPDRAKTQILTELKYSTTTLVIQTFFLGIIYLLDEKKIIQMNSHLNLNDVYAFLLYFAIYDPYFYFLHRFLHQSWLYKNIHVIHHKSMNPTPWASYSFHPIEAILNLLYLFPFLFMANVSWPMFIFLLILTDIGNLAGHLGFDFFSDGKLTQFITTPTHHNQHHQMPKSNYGLYLRCWDQMFKTMNHKK